MRRFWYVLDDILNTTKGFYEIPKGLIQKNIEGGAKNVDDSMGIYGNCNFGCRVTFR